MKIGSGNGDEAESQAAAWAIICAERSLDEEEQQRLDAWLAQGSRNLGAFVRAQAIWADIDRVVALGEGARSEPVEPPAPRRWRRYAMAASVAASLIAGGFTYDRFAGRISTGRGEVREIALEDGSRVILNGDSALQVRFDGDRRRIILRRGEAMFDVAHDSARPFLVSADDVTVRAVGTRFAVGMESDDVEVTVEEGVVAVAERSSAAPPVLTRRNEQLVAAPTGTRRARLEAPEVERQLAWQRGLLIFSGDSLGLAAEQVNRHARRPVFIDDPRLARAEFVGVFRVGDSRTFAHAAAQAFNGAVVEREDGLHLTRQQNSPSH